MGGHHCLCGCGQAIPEVVGNGQRKYYATPACRKRAQRSRDKAVTAEPPPDGVSQVATSGGLKPVLKYPGSKARLASWIVSFFPAHLRYVEPYCGSAACFFAKAPADHEVLNDLYGSLVNFFTVLRDHGEELARRIDQTPWSEEEYHQNELDLDSSSDPVENARRFTVRCWQSHGVRFRENGGGRQGWKHNGLIGHQYPAKRWQALPDRLIAAAARLKDAEIRHRPAEEIIRYYHTSDTLIYCDPPYVRSTRNDRYYAHEMTDEEHEQLLDALDAHPGPVVLSGYSHPLYDERLQHWYRLTMPSVAEHGMIRTEVLWLNQRVARCQQLSLFAV